MWSKGQLECSWHTSGFLQRDCIMQLCKTCLAIGVVLAIRSSAAPVRSFLFRASRLQAQDHASHVNNSALANDAAKGSQVHTAAPEEGAGLLCREYNNNMTDIDVVLRKDGVRDLVFTRTVRDTDGWPLGFEAEGVQSRVRCAPSAEGSRCSAVGPGRPVPKCSAIEKGACTCKADAASTDHLPYQRWILSQVLQSCHSRMKESKPFRALALGLGGGAMPMYLRNHCEAAQVESVEVDSRVIAVAQRLLGFHPDERNKVECADALESLKRREAVILRARDAPHYDLALVDCFEKGKLPISCKSDAFVEALHAVMRPGGNVVQNVMRDDVDDLLRLYKGFFGKVNVTKVEGSNFLLTAYKGA